MTAGSINGLAITGGTIDIGTGAPYPFSVDSDGNAKVSSLSRDDFHWFTVFESVDGYNKITDGAGTIASAGDGNRIVRV